VNVISRAIVRFAAIGSSPQRVGELTGPFLPCEMALTGKGDGKRERLCLPWLGEHRPAIIAG
jgi:hypothetical protein